VLQPLKGQYLIINGNSWGKCCLFGVTHDLLNNGASYKFLVSVTLRVELMHINFVAFQTNNYFCLNQPNCSFFYYILYL
jgi:hypothetical protein